MGASELVWRGVALHLGLTLLLAELKACKHAELGPTRRLTSADHRDLALLSLALTATLAASERAIGLPVVAGVVTALPALLLLSGLLLDTVLFRLFTIELGPGGVSGVVVSALYREVAGLGHARRFARAHLPLLTWPLAAVAALSPLVVPGSSVITVTMGVLAALGLRAVWVWRAQHDAVPTRPAGHRNSDVDDGDERPPCAVLGPGALVRDFLLPRRMPCPPGFTPRPEHVALITPPRRPGRSRYFGALRGHDVLLVTLESLAPGARLPFVESLIPASLVSDRHACVTPLTNDAHLALYRGGYPAQGPALLVEGFGAAGYQRAYLTPARTAHYGLSRLLIGAGFDLIIDEQTLAPSTPVPLEDEVVATVGLDALWAALDPERPLFLHVHTAATHVPYRVADRRRARQLDPDDDRGRLLAGLEEADQTIAQLCARLTERRGRPPLVCITGDHGQSFGEHGYHSHGSSVWNEQLLVPLVMHHPGLPAGRVAFSSHFDVLPTLLDRVGIEVTLPLSGAPLDGGAIPAAPGLMVWAGTPSRGTCSHFGLLLGDEKRLLDLVTQRCLRMNLDDTSPRELDGAERAYTVALMAWTAARHGIR
jgi:hypothetical protein